MRAESVTFASVELVLCALATTQLNRTTACVQVMLLCPCVPGVDTFEPLALLSRDGRAHAELLARLSWLLGCRAL